MQRSLLLLIVSICLSYFAGAQLLSVAPVFPKDTSGIVITVDCSRGNRGLYNYANTSDVYVHIGVITSAGTGAGNWRHVRFAWNYQ